ncbi:MAG TPA: ComEA family DNA-binding protein [Nitrospira sp.]|jgi:competence protein ComEA|nr:ComEA family DNA-binding protein [Nitrospira sp.]
MMLSTLLLRLAMVALTMTVVCWIGWAIPAPRDAGALHPAGALYADGPPVPGSSAKPLAPPAPLRERRQQKSAPLFAISLDVNRASRQDFERLPGIGPVLAGRIIEYREAEGGFQHIEQLRRVKGIGSKTFERIRALVSIVPPVAKPVRKPA